MAVGHVQWLILMEIALSVRTESAQKRQFKKRQTCITDVYTNEKVRLNGNLKL